LSFYETLHSTHSYEKPSEHNLLGVKDNHRSSSALRSYRNPTGLPEVLPRAAGSPGLSHKAGRECLLACTGFYQRGLLPAGALKEEVKLCQEPGQVQREGSCLSKGTTQVWNGGYWNRVKGGFAGAVLTKHHLDSPQNPPPLGCPSSYYQRQLISTCHS
jgi:hypothetical protein